MALRLLKWIAIGHIAAGVVLWLMYFMTSLHPLLLAIIYTGQPGKIANDPQLLFWLCILGPTIASWGVLFFSMLQQFVLYPALPAWRGMVAAVLVWAPLDSMLCLLNGIVAGAAGNLVMTTVLLVLLWRIRPPME